MQRVPVSVVRCLLLLLSISPGSAVTLAGQEVAVAVRGPRFLVASPSPQEAPREVNAGQIAQLRRVVSLNFDRPSIGQVLSEIERQAGVKFFYSRNLLPADRVVSLRAERITVAAALLDVLVDTSLDVLVSPGGARQIALVRRGGTLGVQSGSVSGQVTDVKTGAGLAGVEVSLEGKRWRAATDAEGRYRLADVSPGSYTVLARRIGYAPERRAVTVAAGQEAPVDVALQSAATRLGEVVVTAQKREERVQDVPISIAVLSNEDIERRNLIGMEDYLRSIPGVNQIDQGVFSNAIVIRGVTTSPQEENFSDGTTVAIYFDETPITGAAGMSGGGIDVRPVDIERIEVLRGPQGTAYGSASLGGAMRVIPVKPKLDGFSGKFAGSYSGTSGFGSDNSMIQGVVNIPVVADKLALRAVGYRYEESGVYRNVAGIDPTTIATAESFGVGDYVRGYVQDDVGHAVSTGGRLAALWQATDKLNLSMNFLTQRSEQDGWPRATTGKYEQASFPIASQARVRGEVGEVGDNKIDLVNLVLNYDLGWAALTSAASWIDGGAAAAFGNFAFPMTTTFPSDFESLTFETRLASQLEGRFQFLGGLFYEDVDEDFVQTFDWPGPLPTNPFGTDPILNVESTRGREQRAIFGEVSYGLTDKLTATVGGRYFNYDKNSRGYAEGGIIGIPIGAGTTTVLGNSEDGSSFKANLGYKLTEESLLYASWAEGFRLGVPAPDRSSDTNVCDLDSNGVIDGTNVPVGVPIKSDFLDNYEIGGKFTLFNRRMVVDASVYHIDWKGLPMRFVAPCGFAGIANVGAARSDGVEFQASLFVVDGLRLDFGGGYTKAELSEDAPALSAPKGARLPGSPELSANLAAQYDFDVAGRQAFIRAESFYAGKFHGDLLESPLTTAGDYIKVDARAGVPVRNFSVELFVRNLTNEDAFTWRGLSNTTSFFGYRLRPRTIGIQLGYSFK